MQEFFELIASVGEYIARLVLDVVKVVTLTAAAIVKLPVYLGYLYPTEIVTSIAIFLTVVVLYKVLGRD